MSGKWTDRGSESETVSIPDGMRKGEDITISGVRCERFFLLTILKHLTFNNGNKPVGSAIRDHDDKE